MQGSAEDETGWVVGSWQRTRACSVGARVCSSGRAALWASVNTCSQVSPSSPLSFADASTRTRTNLNYVPQQVTVQLHIPLYANHDCRAALAVARPWALAEKRVDVDTPRVRRTDDVELVQLALCACLLQSIVVMVIVEAGREARALAGEYSGRGRGRVHARWFQRSGEVRYC
jgi:hypothetical protein